jgi:FkbM family methyltransferase
VAVHPTDAGDLAGQLLRPGPRSASARQLILGASRRLGVEPQLRAAQRALESAARRRNRRDDENLRLLLAAVLAPDSGCVDVGANIGSTLASICAAAPSGRHVAFEPLPVLCAQLRARYPTVEVRQAALSDRAGQADFVHVKHLPSRSGLRRPDYAGENTETLRTPVETLDEALAPDYRPALIKIDVEGAEQRVLEGARATLADHRPVIVFEHDPRWAVHYDCTPASLFELLGDELGYRIFDMDGEGPFTGREFVRLTGEGQRWNFFARGH